MISDEKVQLKLPLFLLNYKIPAGCAMPGVNVVCRNFLDYIKLSKVAFGWGATAPECVAVVCGLDA